MLIRPAHAAFNTALSTLTGVGSKISARLAEEGFHTTGDLLSLIPSFYQDRRHPVRVDQVVFGQEALVEGTVVRVRPSWSPRTRRRLLTAVIEDDQGQPLALAWFHVAPYLLKSLSKGRRVRLFGKICGEERQPQMIHPDLEFLPENPSEEQGHSDESSEIAAEIRAVYHPLGELSPNLVKKLINQIKPLLDQCPPLLDPQWLQDHELVDPVAALRTLHFPPGEVTGSIPRPAQTRAYSGLVFFELFFWRLMMLRVRGQMNPTDLRAKPGLDEGLAAIKSFWQTLPFEPSPEQQKVCQEFMEDISSPGPMSRLLQGEVGSGKTAVAGAALFLAINQGQQGAMMAPTELLARQHYELLKKSGEALGFQTVFLTGSLSAKEKQAARQALAQGEAKLVVGTQSLLSPATVFKNLGLAVIDEQHRFGVRQRLALRRKNSEVDILALSATPIPRSLALVLYGDLQHSSMCGLLPGRTPALTTVFQPAQREETYHRFLELVDQGGQGFLVTPRIKAHQEAHQEELSGPPPLEEICHQLQQMAGPDRVILPLHGQLPPKERQQTMDDFRQGRVHILVATSIIEVGVDVPAAKVILIEGAERFGLAQLHQLRGRVGRGESQGHCLLLSSKSTSLGDRRLAALLNSTDGFELAELDLEMRGPGEQLGLKQSGWPPLTYARLPKDLPVLTKAHQLAEQIWVSPQKKSIEKLDFSTLEERLTNTEVD